MTWASTSLVVTTALAIVVTAPTTADADPVCDVRVYRDGAPGDQVCADAAQQRGLTLVDLSATWTPTALAPGPDGIAPSYRTTYLALADGRLNDAGPDGPVAAGDHYLEIHGIVPALPVVGGWLADDARHQCHAAIDDTALELYTGNPGEESAAGARARQRRAAALRIALEAKVASLALADLDGLAATGRNPGRQVARLRAAETWIGALAAVHRHLACDGLLIDTGERFGWKTRQTLTAFQRRELLMPTGRLDAATRAALAEDSRDRDFRAALRVLRERVITATGLIEDGSAGDGNATVLGRRLDPPSFDHVLGHDPLPGAAPDRIAAATEAAARALGWTDPAATTAFLRTPPTGWVAVALPPLPDRTGQELKVEIDRGDVWYDATPRRHRSARRPVLILYAVSATGRTPLVRWPTTIGGWQKQVQPGGRVIQEWKESPVGPRLWRDLYIGPTWLPPPTTPDRELVHSIGGGRWAASVTALGPSYRSAYGLAMLIHEVPRGRHLRVTVDELGIRTHGTGNVASMHDGRSHGCHRLLPVQALRLAGFLLEHRAYVRRGESQVDYVRLVKEHGPFRLHVTTRGYRIELTPPVEVEVLPGRIRSKAKRPPA